MLFQPRRVIGGLYDVRICHFCWTLQDSQFNETASTRDFMVESVSERGFTIYILASHYRRKLLECCGQFPRRASEDTILALNRAWFKTKDGEKKSARTFLALCLIRCWGSSRPVRSIRFFRRRSRGRIHTDAAANAWRHVLCVYGSPTFPKSPR